MPGRFSQRGISVIELIVVVAIATVLTGMTVPALYRVSQSYRVSGAASGLATQLALAKLSAAGQFTHAQIDADLTSESYTIQIWNKSTQAFATDQGGTQYLPAGVVFGYPANAPPAGLQTTIAQTTPIIFDSRGINIAATVPSALYLQDKAGRYAYAVTVSLISKVTVYRYNFANGSWVTP